MSNWRESKGHAKFSSPSTVTRRWNGEKRRNEGGIYIQAGQMEMGDVVPKDNRVESYKVGMPPTLEEGLLCWRRNEVRR